MDEEITARHRKELRSLQDRITAKKKQATKKTRKGVNDECERLEADLRAKHAAELAEATGETADDATDGLEDDLNVLKVEDEPQEEKVTAPPQPATIITETNAGARRPNRQKARLARRAAEQEELARQAAEEAENMPDMKQQERDRMLSYMKERNLNEKEIRADGHCLYSAVADQLTQLGIPLGSTPTEKPDVQYKFTRAAAADYIESHGDDFAPFLEEPLPEYVHKVRDTAEWGGQLELQALAKVYKVEINVLQDFGRVEKIEPDGDAEGNAIWLGYYKHGFGLGEHYNSLRRK